MKDSYVFYYAMIRERAFVIHGNYTDESLKDLYIILEGWCLEMFSCITLWVIIKLYLKVIFWYISKIYNY